MVHRIALVRLAPGHMEAGEVVQHSLLHRELLAKVVAVLSL